MAYPTRSQLVADSTLEALVSLTAAQQDILYLAAKFAVEEYTNQDFSDETAVVKKFDGSGGRRVYLPKRLEAITALSVQGSALAVGDVEIGPDRDVLTVKPDAGYRTYYERALMAIQDYPGLLFTAGTNTVTVTGNWGWATFPQAVRDAMRIDMEDSALGDSSALSQTLRAYWKLGLRDVSQGNLRAAIEGPGALSVRAQTLLQPYIWEGRTGEVV